MLSRLSAPGPVNLSQILEHDEIVLDAQHWFGTRAVGYSTTAAVTFLMYDILLTMPDEIEYVWPTRNWGPTKVTYFFIRYFPLLLSLSTQLYGSPLPLTYSAYGCHVWNVYQGVSMLLIVLAVDYLLILRVFAMYPYSFSIQLTTCAIFGAELITMATGAGLAIPEMTFDKYCVVTHAPVTLMIAAGFPIAYQTFLFAVTMWNYYKAVKRAWGRRPIYRLLLRDGTWAFFLLFFVLCGEALMYMLPTKSYTGLIDGWMITAFSFCGYRIIINLAKFHRIQEDSRYQDSNYEPDGDIVLTSQIDIESPVATRANGGQAQPEVHEMPLYARGEKVEKRELAWGFDS